MPDPTGAVLRSIREYAEAQPATATDPRYYPVSLTPSANQPEPSTELRETLAGAIGATMAHRAGQAFGVPEEAWPEHLRLIAEAAAGAVQAVVDAQTATARADERENRAAMLEAFGATAEAGAVRYTAWPVLQPTADDIKRGQEIASALGLTSEDPHA